MFNPGLVWQHSFVEIYYEMFLRSFSSSIQEGQSSVSGGRMSSSAS